MTPHKAILGLGYSGLLPFALGIYLVLSGQSILTHSPVALFTGYSATVLSFLGGALWGRTLHLLDASAALTLLTISNATALVAWASLVLTPYPIAALVALIIGYVSLLLVEYQGNEKILKDVDRSYLMMRINLTSMVIIAHLVVLPYSI